MVACTLSSKKWKLEIEKFFGFIYIILYRKGGITLLLDMSTGKIFKCIKPEKKPIYTIELAGKSLQIKTASFCLIIGDLIINDKFQILKGNNQQKALADYAKYFLKYSVDVIYEIETAKNIGRIGDFRIITFWFSFINQKNKIFIHKKSLPVNGYSCSEREEILSEYLKEYLLVHITCEI